MLNAVDSNGISSIWRLFYLFKKKPTKQKTGTLRKNTPKSKLVLEFKFNGSARTIVITAPMMLPNIPSNREPC